MLNQCTLNIWIHIYIDLESSAQTNNPICSSFWVIYLAKRGSDPWLAKLNFDSDVTFIKGAIFVEEWLPTIDSNVWGGELRWSNKANKYLNKVFLAGASSDLNNRYSGVLNYRMGWAKQKMGFYSHLFIKGNLRIASSVKSRVNGLGPLETRPAIKPICSLSYDW